MNLGELVLASCVLYYCSFGIYMALWARSEDWPLPVCILMIPLWPIVAEGFFFKGE